MNITVGCLALVCPYGSDPMWFEVIAVGIDSVTCTNGTGEDFEVERCDIHNITDDDSVLM